MYVYLYVRVRISENNTPSNKKSFFSAYFRRRNQVKAKIVTQIKSQPTQLYPCTKKKEKNAAKYKAGK